MYMLMCMQMYVENTFLHKYIYVHKMDMCLNIETERSNLGMRCMKSAMGIRGI